MDPDAHPVPLQTPVLHQWPDDSIHWLLLDFRTSRNDANPTYTLVYGTQVSPLPAEDGLHVHKTEDGITVDTGT